MALSLFPPWSIASTASIFSLSYISYTTFLFFSCLLKNRYPFFGVQFHPEKNLYEWIINRNITHTSTAIRAAQYFANFFVDETRRSQNRFPGGVTEENSVLIYNFHTNFTALVKSAYEQCYLFDEHVSYAKIEGELLNDNANDEPGAACMQSAFVGFTLVVALLTTLIAY